MIPPPNPYLNLTPPLIRYFLLFFISLNLYPLSELLLAHLLHYRYAKGLQAHPLTSQTQPGFYLKRSKERSYP
jgi:hypothetical protein